MDKVQEFQYRLLKAIAEKNVTAADLCRQTGIDKSAMSNYINGKYVPKQDKVLKLAAALDVDAGWLMTGDEPIRQNLYDALYWRYSDTGRVARAFEEAEDWKKEAVKKLLDID